MEEDAEIDPDYARGLINNVIQGMSESEGGDGRKSKKKLKMAAAAQAQKREIPDFELSDIIGEFEIDDLGNFIIVREGGMLMDKYDRRVNRRGYLIDRHGNVINKQGQVIFKAVELEDDDEIPAPFAY